MEDFSIMGFIGGCFGLLIGIFIILILNKGTMPKKSGQYITYENVIYKQVDQEELDKIIVLEMK